MAGLGPLADGIQVDPAGDEGLRQLAAPRLERVAAQCEGPLRLAGSYELQSLVDREQRQDGIQHEVVVVVQHHQPPLQLHRASEGFPTVIIEFQVKFMRALRRSNDL